MGEPEIRTIEPTANEEVNVQGPIRTGQLLGLNHPGRFTIELQVEDLLAETERKRTYKVPIVVVDPATEE